MNLKSLCFAIAIALMFSGTSAQAAKLTHMGQGPVDHVTLEVVGGYVGGCDGPALLDLVRVLPGGASGGAAFRIPEGKALIVTDVDWQYVHPDGSAAAGTMQVLRLYIEKLADPFVRRRAFDSAIVLSNSGMGGVSEGMTSGFVVSSAARICPDVFPGPSGPPSGLRHLLVRGYLVTDK